MNLKSGKILSFLIFYKADRMENIFSKIYSYKTSSQMVKIISATGCCRGFADRNSNGNILFYLSKK